jgi:hypothetical protein
MIGDKAMARRGFWNTPQVIPRKKMRDLNFL